MMILKTLVHKMAQSTPSLDCLGWAAFLESGSMVARGSKYDDSLWKWGPLPVPARGSFNVSAFSLNNYPTSRLANHPVRRRARPARVRLLGNGGLGFKL